MNDANDTQPSAPSEQPAEHSPASFLKAMHDDLASAVAHLGTIRDELAGFVANDGTGEFRFGIAAVPQVERLRLSTHYEATAGVYRRRAERADRSPEQRVEELQRAEWYERRAAVFRAGEEMPAAYRTPRESCAKVDELRKAVCVVAGIFADLTIPEVVSFQRYLQDDTGARLEHVMTADQIKPTLEIFAVHLGTLLHLLGGHPGQPGEPIHLWAFEVPLAESNDAT
jgi:hypothetical protein